MSVEKAQQGLRVLDKGGKLSALLRETGWGSHPVVLSALADLGRQAGEGQHITGHSSAATAKKSAAQIMYPDMYNDDGTPKKMT